MPARVDPSGIFLPAEDPATALAIAAWLPDVVIGLLNGHRDEAEHAIATEAAELALRQPLALPPQVEADLRHFKLLLEERRRRAR